MPLGLHFPEVLVLTAKPENSRAKMRRSDDTQAIWCDASDVPDVAAHGPPKARTGDAVLTSVIRPGKLRGSVKRDAFGLGQLP